MIQGIRNSGVPKHIFRHNDPTHLEQLLKTVGKDLPKVVAFETVHSMTGAVCPLEVRIDLIKLHYSRTFITQIVTYFSTTFLNRKSFYFWFFVGFDLSRFDCILSSTILLV